MLAGLTALGSSAYADIYVPKGSTQSRVPTVQSADDVIASIPVLSKIPRSFIVGDGFRFKLSGMELRIDHMGTNSKSAGAKRNCMIGFSYATPVAFFGSRIDIPFFHAENLKADNWGMNTPGDYVLRFSKDASVQHPTLGLMATARF